MLTFETTLALEEREKIVQQRIESYFEDLAYRTKIDGKGDRYYERGSVWRNFVENNPAKWHVFAYVTMNTTDDSPVKLDIRLAVDTRGQVVLPREQTYWQTEFDVLTEYLQTGKKKVDDILGTMSRDNHRQNSYLLLGLILVACFAFMILLPLLIPVFCSC